MIAAVASGGTLVQPHMLKGFPNPRIDHFNISDDTVEKITQGMYGVVNEGGTAAGAKLQNIEFCGKSGSAQVIGYDVRNRLGKQKDFKDNAWFVGYAPRRNPEIVVAVLVQSGEHGGAIAGPIARDIVKLYYDKKNARSQQQATTQSPALQPEAARQLAATVGAP
jgi:penicillin-binding protein 2